MKLAISPQLPRLAHSNKRSCGWVVNRGGRQSSAPSAKKAFGRVRGVPRIIAANSGKASGSAIARPSAGAITMPVDTMPGPSDANNHSGRSSRPSPSTDAGSARSR
jgi:hypothetical protein